jgi:putative DNA primase/helicase
MQHVLGPDNVSSPNLSGLASDFGLWPLVGKSVAIIPDAHLSRKADDVRILESIKSIVGEDPVNVNRKCLPYLTNVRLGVRFVVTVNELPHFSDSSGALAARLCILIFPKSFLGREDRLLEGKLRAEAPGILNWALTGLQRLQTGGGFSVPKGAAELSANYRRLTNPVVAFLEDCCIVGSNKRDLVDDVYAAWRGWANENGHAPMAKTTLGDRLRTANPAIRRVRQRLSGLKRPYFYIGLSLNTEGRRFVGSVPSRP